MKGGRKMLVFVDTFLKIGGLVFIGFAVVCIVSTIIMGKNPNLTEKVQHFFETSRAAKALLVFFSVWAATGAAYTVILSLV